MELSLLLRTDLSPLRRFEPLRVAPGLDLTLARIRGTHTHSFTLPPRLVCLENKLRFFYLFSVHMFTPWQGTLLLPLFFFLCFFFSFGSSLFLAIYSPRPPPLSLVAASPPCLLRLRHRSLFLQDLHQSLDYLLQIMPYSIGNFFIYILLCT